MLADSLHHYTNINTLALILKNKTIRFNRLDHVDDITEGESFTQLKLEQFFFVSCWTYDHEESLPQWNMYTTDMAGVRITLPKRMFNYRPLVLPHTIRHVTKGSLISPLPFEKIFGDSYFILPMFISENHFARKVEYVSDFVQRKNQAIQTGGIDSEWRIADPTGIAALKSLDWAFQKEYRFVLFIFPSSPIPKDDNFFTQFSEQFPSIAKTSLYYGKGPDFDFFDVEISQTALDRINITTGPLCTEGDFLIVESLLEKYVSGGKVEKSKFARTIRKPRRR
ncbi:MAG: hypothetical protein KKH04_21665 [Proteobacteria bacterium]|nr:hypothetical protein [Pseudomonadota bacterium]